MPWSNQTGNGGWKGGGGGNGGGPWGQRPQGPRPGGGGGGGPNNSPDLEDILRRGGDRLKRALPGGGGSAGGSAAIVLLVVLALGVIWVMKSVYTVQPDEVGVEMLFGKPKEELSEPGLHLAIWPIETVDTVPVVESQITLGSSQSGDNSGLMLSGDQNIVDVQFAVLYQVDNPQNFLFNVQDPASMVQQVSESAMREVVGRRPVQDVFRDDRAGIAEEVREIAQATLNEYGAGVRINGISIEDAAPPPQVADAFDEVQRAEQDEDRFIEEANRYRNQQVGEARGEAAQIREDAAAYKSRVVQEAEGEAQRFTSILTEYAKAPDVTRKRLFLETMEGVLRDSNKIILEGDASGQGVVPYLPLNELQRQNNTTNNDDNAANATNSNRTSDPAARTSANSRSVPGGSN
ncbi:FtsH protease activity modulator HflK [Fulvimarina sp. 2208YS6-2-32]|uniref:Protein HflK n=1 Tax=Fulvimarina uroteuthidis TaxID=3098149 RepID=A0ABU5I0G2_9HYPH|nr:FtsH protease activity modulator HflK [Fulvimarina sp. 2208YS6-2-32]MDY8108612.1 FtsH protease activity modulator HflK [Fulvimarina sp. 2208YS6-2-32]